MQIDPATYRDHRSRDFGLFTVGTGERRLMRAFDDRLSGAVGIG